MGSDYKMCVPSLRAYILLALIAILTSVHAACASEEFNIEEAFEHRIAVPVSVAADIGRSMKASARTCFAASGTTAQEALEATPVLLGASEPVLLIKPKLSSEPKAAWGCYCGAYECRMWIYSFKQGIARKLWSSAGVSLQILDRKSRGFRRLLSLSGSAGHEEAELDGWNGRQYEIVRKKLVEFGQDAEADKQAREAMEKFLRAAVR